jgi:predicted enzyme related to lactoylglutathione lyase
MPKTTGLITFLPYRNLETATRFYKETMGLDLTIDQGFAKIFQVGEAAYLGLIDAKRSVVKLSEDKSVALTILVSNVDEWFQHLTNLGIPILSEPHDVPEINIRLFLLKDPNGYTVEIQHFY